MGTFIGEACVRGDAEGDVLVKTPQGIMLAVAAFWLGHLQGAESPGTIVRDTVFFTAGAIAAAVLCELVARRAKART